MRLAARRVSYLIASCLVVALPACGSSSGSSNASFTLEIANFSPFSGPNADYGAYEQGGCAPAVNLINTQGGVLGHQLSCQIVDDRGDPADAVLAAQKLLATAPHLVAIVDGNSGLLTTTSPLFNAAHIPELSLGGDIQFDQNTLPYFWRTIPGDDIAGYALAAYLKFNTPYTRVASMFTSDPSAQGNVPGLAAGAKNLNLTVTITEALAVDQTSYHTEIARMLATHPDVMASESDPQTAGVLLGNLKQAAGLLPIVGTSGTLGTDYDKAAQAAIGTDNYNKYFVRVEQYAPSTGPAWETWNKALTASASQVKDPKAYATSIYAEDPYDNVIMIALAMIAANSIDPATFNPYIPKITQGSTVVHTFADGKAALQAGKTVDFVGVEGQITFDKYHNATGSWGVFSPLDNKLLATVTPQQVAQATAR
jgi:branched-chain amino acid transport system substrate-binding protein